MEGNADGEAVTHVAGIPLDLKDYRNITIVGEGSVLTPDLHIKVLDKRLTQRLAAVGFAPVAGFVAYADGLRACAREARNDRSCEQIAAFIGEQVLRYLEGSVTPVAVQVRLECDNGDEVEWNAVEAELVEVVIDGPGDSSGATA